MEEMMLMMMKIRSQPASDYHSSNIPSTSLPTWKLYENPFYISHNINKNQNSNHQHQLLENNQQQVNSTHHNNNQEQIHRLHLPVSTRKIAASFWDLTFVKPLMESELEMARSHIEQLKAELECERKARKKMESLNKRLVNELSEERKAREAVERVCQELVQENSLDKAEMIRMKMEMAEERKMLRVAEVIREERVQMKLAEAKILMEEKLSKIETAKERGTEGKKESKINHEEQSNDKADKQSFSFRERIRFVLGEKMPTPAADNGVNFVHSMTVMQRKPSSEAENPHIKRGIKGFVEFPKVVRAIGCRSRKHFESKLECQKAQLKILLKQKGNVRFNGLMAS